MLTMKMTIFALFCCLKTFKNMLNQTECFRNKDISISCLVKQYEKTLKNNSAIVYNFVTIKIELLPPETLDRF